MNQQITTTRNTWMPAFIAGALGLLALCALAQTPESVANPATRSSGSAAVVKAVAGDGEVTLLWTPASAGVTYDVQMATDRSEFSVIAKGVASTSVIVKKLTNGTTYRYLVTAVDPSGTRSNSSEVSVIPQASKATTSTGPEVVMNATTHNGGFETAGEAADAAAGWMVDKGAARRVAGGGGANNSQSYLATELTYREGSSSGEKPMHYQYMEYPMDVALPHAAMEFQVSAWIKDAPQKGQFNSYAITVWVAYDNAEGKTVSKKHIGSGWIRQRQKADDWTQVSTVLKVTTNNRVSVDPGEWANGRNHRITKITLENAHSQAGSGANGTVLGRLWDDVTIVYAR